MERAATSLLPGNHHLPAVRDERLDRRPAGLRPEMRRDAAEEERHRPARLPARGDPRRETLPRRDVGEQPFPRRELRRQAGQHRLHEPAKADAPRKPEQPHRRFQDRGPGHHHPEREPFQHPHPARLDRFLVQQPPDSLDDGADFHSRRTDAFAAAAGEALVEVLRQPVARGQPALQQGAGVEDLPARGERLARRVLVGGTRRQAETAVDAGERLLVDPEGLAAARLGHGTNLCERQDGHIRKACGRAPGSPRDRGPP